MQKGSLILFFFLAFFIALFQSALLGKLHLFAFAPFLAILWIRSSFIASLWGSFLCGFLLDLFSSGSMGILALNYTFICLFLYRFHMHFYDDKPLHLAFYTALISSLSTLIQPFLLFLFDRSIPVSGKWVLTDLFLMPLLDGAYAIIWFWCPFILYQKIYRKMHLFLLKRR